MPDRLFDRRCRVTIRGVSPTPGDYLNPGPGEAIQIDGPQDAANPGLRMQFKIKKSLEKEPNTCEVTITNLSPTRRHSFKKNMKLLIEAGYADTGITRLFAGDVRTVDHKREGADWETVLHVGDGERAFRWAFASESFAAGTDALSVIKYLAGQIGLPLGHTPTGLTIGITFDQGYVVHAPAQRAMADLVRGLGFTWSIQDQAIQILAPGETLSTSVPEISVESGLIGSPEMGTPEKKGKPPLLKVKTLLLPTRPGAVVRLRSERYNGLLRVKKLDHDGDTSGGPWYTSILGTIK